MVPEEITKAIKNAKDCLINTWKKEYKSEEELHLSALQHLTSAFIGHCEDLKEFHDINGKDKKEWEEYLDKIKTFRMLYAKALGKEPYGINGRINLLLEENSLINVV